MKVNNKGIIRTLTWRSLKANRGRNLIAVLAIALTATLFTTIFAIGGNMVDSMQDGTMRQVGTSAHSGLKYLTQEQYDRLSASTAYYKDMSYSIIVAGADNPELQKKQTEIRYAQDQWARWGFSYPTTGTMPKDRMDLACSTITLDALGIPHQLGQTVHLEFTVHGQKYAEDFTLCGFWQGDDVMQAAMVFLSREFTDAVAPVPATADPSLGFDGIVGTINADVNFKSSADIEAQTVRLIEAGGYAPYDIGIGVNWAYLGGGSIDFETVLLVGVVGLLILVSGYLIIYSIFTISVTGDIRFYGLLKTIGTTGRQLRRIVRWQALALSALGIPLGLLLGFGLGWVLTPFAMAVTTMDAARAVQSANPLIFVFAAVFSLVTVFISCRKPGRIAARVSPVEAVRYVDAPAGGKGKEKRSRRVNPFSMAWRNVGRSKKRLAVVVASLSLSLILLNSVFSIVQGFSMDEYLKNQIASDFSVSDHSVYSAMVSGDNYEGVDPGVLTGIQSLAGLEEAGSIYFRDDYSHRLSSSAHENTNRVLDAMEPEFTKTWPHIKEDLDQTRASGEIPLHIYGLAPMAARIASTDAYPLDAEKLAGGDYAYVSHLSTDYQQELDPIYGIGDVVELVNDEGESRSFEVIGFMKYPYPLSAQHGHLIDTDVVISEDAYLDFYGPHQPMMTVFDVDDTHLAAAESWVKSYCENGNPSLDYRSREFYRGEFEAMQNTFLVCGGALAFILLLIGVLNFVNTSFTSILARRRELAMLQSVGMTGRQLKTMLFSEGGCYALLTVLFTLTLGTLISWGIVQGIAGQIMYFRWSFTLTPMLWSVPLLALVCAAVPLFCYRFMRRESVVDRLRQD